MTKLKDVRQVLVVGLGVTGAAVARALLAEGLEVRVSDSGSSSALMAVAGELERLGAKVELSGHNPSMLEGAQLVVPSKGVPPSNLLIAEALRRGVSVWSEFELAWQMGTNRVLAITGTNGKTTTTTLLAEMLKEGGLPAVAAGNLPTPLVEVAKSAVPGTYFVCEASSFGLFFIEEFRPEVAVVTNVADDHYDWHSGFEDYLDAKARITENQTSSDLLVSSAFDAGALEIARRSNATLGAFGAEDHETVIEAFETKVGRKPGMAGGVEHDVLLIDTSGERIEVVGVADIRIPGRHNVENVLAASMAAIRVGCSPEAVAQVVKSFRGLPHVMTFVAEIDGVVYIDDSKSTNPHSTHRAMELLDRVVLIAGGLAKGLDLNQLSPIKKKLSGVVVMGESSEDLEKVFSGVRTVRAKDVEEAVELAAKMACAGDTVLLSPAASSRDQYSSYAERGDRFVKAVLER